MYISVSVPLLPHTSHVPPTLSPPCFYFLNNISYGVQVVKLLFVPFSPAPLYFVLLRAIHLPQHVRPNVCPLMWETQCQTIQNRRRLFLEFNLFKFCMRVIVICVMWFLHILIWPHFLRMLRFCPAFCRWDSIIYCISFSSVDFYTSVLTSK
jgi:hypothetical protein